MQDTLIIKLTKEQTERKRMNEPETIEAAERASGSPERFVSRLGAHIAQMAAHQRERKAGQLLIEAHKALTEAPTPVACTDWLERNVVLKAIADEPEYPGDCPPLLVGYIRQAIQDKDQDAILHMLRQTVRLTKECITERVNGLRSNE